LTLSKFKFHVNKINCILFVFYHFIVKWEVSFISSKCEDFSIAM
jgi:hypothetical protein